MSEFSDYAVATGPVHYWLMNHNGVNGNSSEIDLTGSKSMSTQGTLTGNGSGLNLLEEDDGNSSFQMDETNYFSPSAGSSSIRNYTVSFAMRHENPTGFHCILGGAEFALYITNNRLCWKRSNSPVAGLGNADFIGPIINPDTTYFVTITSKFVPSHTTIRIWLNGILVFDSLTDAGHTVAGDTDSRVVRVGTNYFATSSFNFGKSTSEFATIQHLIYHSRVLSDFEISKMGYLFRYTALPVTVSGTIIEGYQATHWRVRIHRSSDGTLLQDVITETGTFSEYVPDVECYVIVSAVQGDQWMDNVVYPLGQKVYPRNPSVTRFYFECTTAGTSGSTEPTWNTNQATTTSDGTVVWTVVEALIQPITHSPVHGI